MRIIPELNNQYKKLLGAFIEGFDTIYRSLEPCEQPGLLRLCSPLFRKWSDSPLLDETILSPNNLIASTYRGEGVVAPAIRAELEESGLVRYRFALLRYTLEDSPFIDDMLLLLDACRPYAELDADGYLSNDLLEKTRLQLSQTDPFYVEYLMFLAMRMELLVPLPAIGRELVQPARKAEELLTNSDPEELWDLLVENALAVAAEEFSHGLINLGVKVTPDFFRNLLQHPLTLDEIFTLLYRLMGVDTDQPTHKEAEDGDPADDSFLYNTTMYLGTLLDRWFLAPFGQYMKLIKPLSLHHYDFEEELNFVCSGLPVDPDASMEVFSPCLLYDISPLGRQLWEVDKGVRDRQVLNPSLPFSDIWRAYRVFTDGQRPADDLEGPADGDVYTLRIHYADTSDLWKVMQCTDDLSLEELHEELADLFDLEMEGDYFFKLHDEEYSPNRKGRLRIRQSADIALSGLGLTEGDHLLYRPADAGAPALVMHLERKSSFRPCLRYPRLIAQSKAMSDYERSLYYN